MKTIVLATLLSAFATTNSGAQCIDNVDELGQTCTTWTYGQIPTGSYYAVLCGPVTSQDDVAAPFGKVCPNGFYGGGSLQIELPFTPVAVGTGALKFYICAQSNMLGNRTGPVTVPGNTLDQTWDLVCGSWVGSINYHYVNRKVPTGGRLNPYAWKWVQVSGSGELALVVP